MTSLRFIERVVRSTMSYGNLQENKRQLPRCTDVHRGQQANVTDLCFQPKPNLSIQNESISESGSVGTKARTPRRQRTEESCYIASSSTTAFAPSNFTTTSTIPEPLLIIAQNGKAAPITIPCPTFTVRDINSITTPVSGRGDRKTHLFPFKRSPSPRRLSASLSGKYRSDSPNSDSEEWSVSPASSTSENSIFGISSMHNDSISVGRYPTSPLSPKPPTQQSLSPQNSQRRGNHGRQASRNTPSSLGRFHPSNFSQPDAIPSSSAAMQAPQITYSRAPPVLVESPRLLREKHREFLEKAKLSSKLAASPLAIKPDAPRLDPLGSPKGPVTPLALEEANDYFSVVGAGRISPSASPGSRSPRSRSVSDDEDVTSNKSRKLVL